MLMLIHFITLCYVFLLLFSLYVIFIGYVLIKGSLFIIKLLNDFFKFVHMPHMNLTVNTNMTPLHTHLHTFLSEGNDRNYY